MNGRLPSTADKVAENCVLHLACCLHHLWKDAHWQTRQAAVLSEQGVGQTISTSLDTPIGQGEAATPVPRSTERYGRKCCCVWACLYVFTSVFCSCTHACAGKKWFLLRHGMRFGKQQLWVGPSLARFRLVVFHSYLIINKSCEKTKATNVLVHLFSFSTPSVTLSLRPVGSFWKSNPIVRRNIIIESHLTFNHNVFKCAMLFFYYYFFLQYVSIASLVCWSLRRDFGYGVN